MKYIAPGPGAMPCRARGGECGAAGRCGEGPALYKEATDCNREKNNQDCCIYFADMLPTPQGK